MTCDSSEIGEAAAWLIASQKPRGRSLVPALRKRFGLSAEGALAAVVKADAIRRAQGKTRVKRSIKNRPTKAERFKVSYAMSIPRKREHSGNRCADQGAAR